jgi:hypothetical protein
MCKVLVKIHFIHTDTNEGAGSNDNLNPFTRDTSPSNRGENQ